MPFFSRQVDPIGLMVLAYVGVSHARRTALTSAGQATPNLVQIQAMIDTGASCTCIDPSVLKQLSLTPTGSSPLNTPSTGHQPATADQYDVSIIIPGATIASPHLTYNTIAVLETVLLPMGFHALIGRDILQGCLLTYNGQSGLFTIAY